MQVQHTIQSHNMYVTSIISIKLPRYNQPNFCTTTPDATLHKSCPTYCGSCLVDGILTAAIKRRDKYCIADHEYIHYL